VSKKVSCCGKKLKPGAKECPRCHRVTKAGLNANLRKAVAAQPGARFVTKAAGGPPVTYCAVGHRQLPGGNLCSECIELMPGVRVPSMTEKTAFARGYWERELGDSPDRGIQELLQQMIYQGGRG
jgi:hypothetical protein